MRRLLLSAVLLLAAMPAAAETLVIRAGHLITDAALPARGASSIVVTDGRIVSIGAADMAVPAGARVVDLSTKTVMPGLIDVHVHLTQDSGLPWYATLRPKFSEPYAATTGLKNALITARAGFTTVRDAGGPTLASLAMRDAVAEGASRDRASSSPARRCRSRAGTLTIPSASPPNSPTR